MSYYYSRTFQFVPLFVSGAAKVYNVPMRCAVRRGPSFIFDRSSLLPRVERCCSRLGAAACVVFGSSAARPVVPVCVAIYSGGVFLPLWFGSSAAPSVPSQFAALVERAAGALSAPVA